MFDFKVSMSAQNLFRIFFGQRETVDEWEIVRA